MFRADLRAMCDFESFLLNWACPVHARGWRRPLRSYHFLCFHAALKYEHKNYGALWRLILSSVLYYAFGIPHLCIGPPTVFSVAKLNCAASNCSLARSAAVCMHNMVLWWHSSFPFHFWLIRFICGCLCPTRLLSSAIIPCDQHARPSSSAVVLRALDRTPPLKPFLNRIDTPPSSISLSHARVHRHSILLTRVTCRSHRHG